MTSSVRFTEEMLGHVTFGETAFARGAQPDRDGSSAFKFHLTIEVSDIESFGNDPLRPSLPPANAPSVVTVGGLALRRMLGLTDLTAAIGECFERDGVPVVPLPHPSGASSWPHQPGNSERLHRALSHVGSELARL